MTNTAPSHDIALASADDLLTTVNPADLLALLQVAAIQMEACDLDELEGYDLTPGEALRLYAEAQRVMAAIPTGGGQ